MLYRYVTFPSTSVINFIEINARSGSPHWCITSILVYIYCTQCGITALSSASWEGHQEVVRLLLQEKADVNIRDEVHVPSVTRKKESQMHCTTSLSHYIPPQLYTVWHYSTVVCLLGGTSRGGPSTTAEECWCEHTMCKLWSLWLRIVAKVTHQRRRAWGRG